MSDQDSANTTGPYVGPPPKKGLGFHLGIQGGNSGEGWVEMDMPITDKTLRARTPGLHAGSVVSLADSACGWGCRAHLPEDARTFVTVELKCNMIGTVREGHLMCRAELEHGGRTTQIWAAKVWERDSGKQIALFRCTQMILYPEAAA